MRIAEKRFSVPFCALEDRLPPRTFQVLAFLFSESDCAGFVRRASYERIKQGTGIVSRTAISRAIKTLQKKGWFYQRKKTNGAQLIQLRIPTRFVTKLPTAATPENVVEMPKSKAVR